MLASERGRTARAQGQPTRLTLAPRYVPQKIDSPTPAVGAAFAEGFVNAGDVDRDGEDDLLVPQIPGPGKMFVISGANGRLIRTLNPPSDATSTAGAAAQFGRYVAKVEDLGSCPGGQPSQACPSNPIGGRDGIAELAVGATGVDGDLVDIGRAWVLDGATGAVLKRLEMPPADRAAQAALSPAPRPNFGRTVLSPSSPYPPTAPTAVKIGDLDGGGQADIVVAAFGYNEAGPASNPSCDPGPCNRSGRAYFYRGEDVAGSNPGAVLETPFKTIRNPMAQTDDPNSSVDINSELLGHSAAPVGDVGRCGVDPGPGVPCPPASSSNQPDGRPDVVISAFRTNFPPGFFDSGVSYLLDGPTGSILLRYDHPEPQYGAIFGATDYNQPAIGDVGDTLPPDVYLPAYRQNGQFLGQGRGYVMNGDFKVFPDNVSFSQLDDPTPQPGGNFGTSAAGVGDVAGDPRNEILIGSVGPRFPGIDQSILNDVHFFSPFNERVLLSIPDPDRQGGSAFGSGVTPLGDLNDDGFLDFAVGAGRFDGSTGTDEGRLYIFRSRATAAVGRRVSLSLGGHLLARGRVTASGTEDAALLRECVARVPVSVRRNGATVKRAVTNANGSYSARLPDRPGRYQAAAARVEKRGAECLQATSAAVAHRH